MPNRPPSISEVARMAGVSRSAVSRAYTRGASVAPATRQRITEAARTLGYRPNLLARSLSRRASRTVGIAITRLGNPFNATLLQALSLALQAHGYGIRLFVSHGDHDADPGLDDLVEHRVDALIACAIDLGSTLAHDCAAMGLPVVMVNRRTDGPGPACVTGDNRAGGAMVARFLLACGHRRFGFIGGTPGASTSRDRCTGFVETLAAAGVAPPRVAPGMWDAAVAGTVARHMLATPDPPDAIFCANDDMAMAVLTVAVQTFGRVPGDDLSIVGFDDTPQASNGIGLTTFSQPVALLAERAVAAALAMIDGTPAPPAEIVPGRLIVRGSSRRPAPGCHDDGGVTVWTDPA